MEEWISDRLPRVTRAELESRARFFSRELASAGITAFTDATARNGLDEISTLARLVAGGSICQHTSAMVGASHLDAIPTIRQIAASAGIGLQAVKFIDAVAMGDVSPHPGGRECDDRRDGLRLPRHRGRGAGGGAASR